MQLGEPSYEQVNWELQVSTLRARIAELEAVLRDLLEPTPHGEPVKRWAEKLANARAVLGKS